MVFRNHDIITRRINDEILIAQGRIREALPLIAHQEARLESLRTGSGRLVTIGPFYDDSSCASLARSSCPNGHLVRGYEARQRIWDYDANGNRLTTYRDTGCSISCVKLAPMP
jgi:hypothetical protein